MVMSPNTPDYQVFTSIWIETGAKAVNLDGVREWALTHSHSRAVAEK